MTPRIPKDNVDSQLTQVVSNTGGVDPIVEDKKEQVEGIMQNEGKGNSESSKILQENQVERRVYFIRHGITYEDENSHGGAQPKNAHLSENGKLQMKNTAKQLRASGITKDNTLFVYSGDTDRATESLEIIIQEFGLYLKDSDRIEDNNKLSSSGKDETQDGPKHHKDEKRLMADVGVMKSTIELMYEIRTNPKYEQYKNIVLIGHKSNKGGVTESVENKDRPIKGGFDIENGGILEFDISLKGNWINYQKNKTILFVNNQNYQSLPPSFLKIPHTSITDLQNKINAHFIRNPQLFEKYISSGNVDLKAFCVANLLKDRENKGNIGVVTDYYKGANKILSEKEENILWENRTNPGALSTLANLARKGLVKGALIRDQLTEFVKVLDIQSRSLDVKIQEQDSDGVLMRDVFWVEERVREIDGKNSLGWKEDGKKEKITEHITHKMSYEDILMSTNGTGKFVLPAHVGSGKSIWLSEFAKKVMLDHPEYTVYFFEGSDFNGSKKENRIRLLEEQLKGANDKSIVFVDAIDEIRDDMMKQEIKKFLETTKSRVIVTGRPSEYNDKENHGFTTLQVRPISKEDFIHSRIGDEKRGREVLRIIKTSNLSQEVEGNPLLLNFVCILANLSSTEQAKYQDFGIKSLGDMGNKDLENIIRNKSDLYESITRLIIYRHNEGKGIHLSKEELDTAMRELSKVAHRLFGRDNSDISDEYLQKLNILFKKSKTGELQFIHKSFREFLLAKYLINQTNGSEEIYNYRDKKRKENKWNDWREFKLTTLFYGEMLGGAGKKEELEIFLGERGLLAEDDVFGEGFFMGLEILHGLEREGKIGEIIDLKKVYIHKIGQWDKKELLNKLNKFIDFQKRIGYGENKFAQEYIQKCIDANLMSDLSNGELLRLGTKEGSVHMYKLALKLFEEGEYNKASSLFIELAKLGSKKGVEYAYRCGLGLIKTEEYGEDADWIFIKLARLGSREGMRYAYEGAYRLIKENKKGLYTERVFEELGKLGTKEGMRYAYEGALHLIKVEAYFSVHSVFEELAKLGSREGMRYAYEGGLRLIEEEKSHKNNIWCSVDSIFIELARVGTREGIENACKFGFDLIKRNEYNNARSIFNELVELGSKIGVEYIRKFGLKLIELGDHNKRKETFVGLAKLGIREGVEYVSQCDPELYQVEEYDEMDDDLFSELLSGMEESAKYTYGEGLRSIKGKSYHTAEDAFIKLAKLRTQEGMEYAYEGGLRLLEVERYDEAENIFKELAKLRTQEGMEYAYEGGLKLIELERYNEAKYIFLKLIDLGTEEGMRYAYEGGIRLIKKKGYKDDFEVPMIFYQLAKLKNEDGIRCIYERGLELIENDQKGRVTGIIFGTLASLQNEKCIIYAYKGALKMLENKLFEGAMHVFLMLAKLGNEEGLEYAYKCGIEMIKNEEYRSAYHVFTEFVELGTEECMKYAHDGGLKLLEVGEYYKASYLFTELSKTGEKKEFTLSTQKSLDGLYEIGEYSEYLTFIDDLQGSNYMIAEQFSWYLNLH